MPGVPLQCHTALDPLINKLWDTYTRFVLAFGLQCEQVESSQLLPVPLSGDPVSPTIWLIVGGSLKLDGCNPVAANPSRTNARVLLDLWCLSSKHRCRSVNWLNAACCAERERLNYRSGINL